MVLLLEGEVAQVSQPGADQRARHHVAQEMHAEQDARHRDAESAEQQSDGERRIKQRQRYGHRERRHGVAGGERELIGRKQGSPAMRFDLAGPPASREALQAE